MADNDSEVLKNWGFKRQFDGISGRQSFLEAGLKNQELGSRSRGADRRACDLEDHRYQANEEELRACLRANDERWNSRIWALKELMNNHLPAMEEEAPPEAPPASPPARAVRSLSIVRGLLGCLSPVRQNSHGMSLDQDSFLTFDSATDWDVVDDEEEEGDLLNDDFEGWQSSVAARLPTSHFHSHSASSPYMRTVLEVDEMASPWITHVNV